ncbi:MAG: T9SS type A sorting domain-containing protein [Balneolaceae bacterium]
MPNLKRSSLLSNKYNLFLVTLISIIFGTKGLVSAQPSGFGSPLTIGNNVSTNIFEIKMADMDGDGVLDVVTASPYKINWIKNNGDGSFGKVKSIFDLEYDRPKSEITSMDVGDANNDGYIDVSWTYYNNLDVGLNDSSGNFDQIVSTNLSNIFWSTAIAKKHKDSLNSVFSIYDWELYEYKIEGNELVNKNLKGEIYFYNTLITDDLNNDGFSDFLDWDDRYAYVQILFGSENGVGTRKAISIGDISTGDKLVNAGFFTEDILGNGFKDILIYSEIERSFDAFKEGTLVLHENLDGTTFEEAIHLGTVGSGFSSAVMLDVDQDGLKDIVAASVTGFSEKSELYWYKNLADGNFSEAALFAETLNQYDKLVVEDLDGDGIEDLIAGSSQADETIWFKIRGVNDIEKNEIGTSNLSSPMHVAGYDVDMDGYKDLLFSSGNNKKALTWFKNNGDFQFDESHVIDGQSSPIYNLINSQIKTIDIDNSGQEDILVSKFSGIQNSELLDGTYKYFGESILLKFTNYGMGHFSGADTIFKSDQRASQFSLGDFDGDEDADFIIGQFENNQIWSENLEDGNFQQHDLEFKYHLNETADIDKDGRDEIIMAASTTESECDPMCSTIVINKVFFYSISSDSNTYHQLEFQLPRNAQINAINNITLDEQQNIGFLFSANLRGFFTDPLNKLGILVKADTADAVWTPVIIDSSRTAFNDIFVADIDNDDDQDIITITDVTNNGYNTILFEGNIWWYENNGSGEFTKKATIDSSQAGVSQIIAMDVNNDGLKEILTVNTVLEQIKIYPNEMNGPVVSNENFGNLPEIFELNQNYPNPFNPSTTISFKIPAATYIQLSVYNILGQKVTDLLNERITAGNHSVNFNAQGLASGVYFYQLKAGENIVNKKMLLLK